MQTLRYNAPMRNKVLAVFETFSEGCSIRKAREKHGLHPAHFYAAINSDQELKAQYLALKKSRGDMLMDRAAEIAWDCGQTRNPLAVELGTEKPPPDPRLARVAIDGLRAAAGVYDREQFGDKLALQIEAKPSITAAIEAGKQRASLPMRDLAQVTDAQVVDVTPQLVAHATDVKSDAAPSTPANPEFVDPFAD